MNEKDSKENPLIFEIGPNQKVTIYANCGDWYLRVNMSHDSKSYSEKRQYLSNEWFYEALKDNPQGIFKFASLFEYECTFEEGEKAIKGYKNEFENETASYGFDTWVAIMEEFVQDATKNQDIHWW